MWLKGDDVTYVRSGGCGLRVHTCRHRSSRDGDLGLSLTGPDALNYTVEPRLRNGRYQSGPALHHSTESVEDVRETFSFTGTEFDAVGLIGEDTVDSVTLTSNGHPGECPPPLTPYATEASEAVGKRAWRLHYLVCRW